jgi:hypothetical protein
MQLETVQFKFCAPKMKPGALNCFVFPVSTVTIERDVGSADA